MRGLFENVETNMERAVAITKLGKLLGKSMGYRIDPRAPTQEDRDEARAQLPAATAAKKVLGEQMTARRSAVLQADAEYQQLAAAYKEACQRSDKLFSTTHHYKITVGTSNSLFFHVKAQGDSWEDVISKLTVKQAA